MSEPVHRHHLYPTGVNFTVKFRLWAFCSIYGLTVCFRLVLKSLGTPSLLSCRFRFGQTFRFLAVISDDPELEGAI